uniref:NAD-dependent epimerase/dehydratase n=1 Tax=Medicago truncatula TaxID=3880 RepID=A2Q3Y1_MEDTR|nr:NAD-dependent epimerase/dehydratase [Medicago truncatula]
MTDRKKDVSFLTNLPGASQKLIFFGADLSIPESFNAAIEGCSGIFHTASPMDMEMNESEETVTKRTIDGALGILKACKNSKTVKRVIYTSSASAVYWQDKDDNVMDESYWSDENILRDLKPFGWSYSISKTMAEKVVLEFGEQLGLDVVTIIPTLVVGSFICPKLPGSIYTSLSLLFGYKIKLVLLSANEILVWHKWYVWVSQLFGPEFDSYVMCMKKYLMENVSTIDELPRGDKNPFGFSHLPMVHVDDIARAHIFLLEHPNPKGRYNCSPFMANIEEIAQHISSKYPEIHIPTLEELKDIKGDKLPHLTSKKLMDAGFEFKHSLEEMLDDTIQCCKDKAYL